MSKSQAYPFYSPRFWHGMRFGDYLKLLHENGYRLHPARMPMAAILLFVTPFNSAMAAFQRLAYGRRIRDTQVQPPVFIIGHWRSGTTFLHELIVRDERFAFPTTYECFAASHFLVTGRVLPPLIKYLLPARRPMDDMLTGWDRPQEDEFALLTLGVPTPYRHMAFPNRPPRYLSWLDLGEVSAADRAVWSAALRSFLQALTLQDGRPLILKSPPHTGRIKYLADLFPGARFIHITRHPFMLFASTRRLWQALDQAQGLQVPRHQALDEYILSSLERMYRGFARQREQLAPEQFCQLRYEDLVRDPLGQLATVYQQLRLGDFEAVRPKVEAFVHEQRDYRPNRHQLEPAVVDTICRRWSYYFDTFGYTADDGLPPSWTTPPAEGRSASCP